MDSSRDLPQDWIRSTLGRLASYTNGFAFKPDDWSEHGLPIIRIAQMTDPSASPDRYQGHLSDRFRVETGDLLFSWSATLMAMIWDRGPGFVNQHVFKVEPADGTDKSFLHHLLNFSIDALGGQSHGTTMRHIKRSDLLPFEVAVPAAEAEQHLLAQILDTLDEVIRNTEQLNAKLKKVKQGLLRDLLTRGIDEDGEIRDPERFPEQFVRSSLGAVPVAWNLVPLQTLCEHITKGATPTTFGFAWAQDGVPFYRSECVRDGTFTLDGAEVISEQAHRAMSRSAVRAGDILMTITGYIGRSCRYPSGMPEGNINQHIARIRVVDPRLLPEFATWALRDERQQRLLNRDLTGLAYPQISLSQVQTIPMPLPSHEEQVRIAACLDSMDARQAAEEASAMKLRLLKAGLADDLLTGRVRVTSLMGQTIA